MTAAEMSARLATLASLPAGWDSHGAPPITRPALSRAQEIVASGIIAAPAIIPMSDGGILIECHGADVSIEITINPTGEVSVWGQDDREVERADVLNITLSPEVS